MLTLPPLLFLVMISTKLFFPSKTMVPINFNIFTKIWQLLTETFREWQQDKASRLAAALAYYTVFSIAPLLIIAIAIAGSVFGQAAAKEQIVGQLKDEIGAEGAKAVVAALNNASQPELSGIASLISIGILLIGASGIFAELQDALNTVWKVQPQTRQGFWLVVGKRLSSFLMVLSIGLLLIVSLIVSTLITTLSKYRTDWDFLPGSAIVWENLDLIVSFSSIAFLFALMFKYVPDAKIAWKDVWVGSIITSLLFAFGKSLLGWYIGSGNLNSTYGAASSLIVFLVWIYYSAQIVLLGAEFTQVYARLFGSQITQTSRDPISIIRRRRKKKNKF
jgi:membrane protein